MIAHLDGRKIRFSELLKSSNYNNSYINNNNNIMIIIHGNVK